MGSVGVGKAGAMQACNGRWSAGFGWERVGRLPVGGVTERDGCSRPLRWGRGSGGAQLGDMVGLSGQDGACAGVPQPLEMDSPPGLVFSSPGHPNGKVIFLLRWTTLIILDGTPGSGGRQFQMPML